MPTQISKYNRLSKQISEKGISILPPYSEIISAVQLANSYWKASYPLYEDNKWDSAVYFHGAVAVAEYLNDTNTWNYILGWGNKHSWLKPVRTDAYHADDQTAGQSYIDYYRHEGRIDVNKYSNTLANLTAQIALPAVNYWTWCDALYMAMPTFVKVGVEEDDNNFLDKMYSYFRWSGYEQPISELEITGLYDTDEHLWFRDAAYVYPKVISANGQKVFWSRGNGWVFGMLVRILTELPIDNANRAEYITMFQNMAAKLITIQNDTGLWSANLLDPQDPDLLESSGTSFFVWGMAWGVRNGFLDSTYLPFITKGWNGLIKYCLRDSGIVGWTQDIGKDPYPATLWNSSSQGNYAVGAFLQAGIEIAKLKGTSI